MNSPDEPTSDSHRGGPTADSERVLTELHAELSAQMERVAWAILRDWQLAADAVQDAFQLFSEQMGDISPERQRGWLIKTVQLQSMNVRRTRKRRDAKHELLRESLPRYAVPDDPVVEQEERDRIAAAIESLPEAQRQVVVMRIRDEKSFAEIAELLDVAVGTVLSRMRLGLEKLRAGLIDE